MQTWELQHCSTSLRGALSLVNYAKCWNINWPLVFVGNNQGQNKLCFYLAAGVMMAIQSLNDDGKCLWPLCRLERLAGGMRSSSRLSIFNAGCCSPRMVAIIKRTHATIIFQALLGLTLRRRVHWKPLISSPVVSQLIQISTAGVNMFMVAIVNKRKWTYVRPLEQDSFILID